MGWPVVTLRPSGSLSEQIGDSRYDKAEHDNGDDDGQRNPKRTQNPPPRPVDFTQQFQGDKKERKKPSESDAARRCFRFGAHSK